MNSSCINHKTPKWCFSPKVLANKMTLSTLSCGVRDVKRKLFTFGVYLIALQRVHRGKNPARSSHTPHVLLANHKNRSPASSSSPSVSSNHAEASNMLQHVELCPVSVSETHRKAHSKKKLLWLKTGTFHTNAVVSRWPWWETRNQVSLASAILVDHLH